MLMKQRLSVSRWLLIIAIIVLSTSALMATDQTFPLVRTGRAYYFISYLAYGVPTSGYNASPYLPEGMKGIGLEAAQAIWTSAMGKQSQLDITVISAATLASAAKIYGRGSEEFDAVKKAWKALNVTAATITVTNPAGGENWRANTKHTIKWTYTGTPGSYVKIVLHEVFSAYSKTYTVTSKTSIGSEGSGSYIWTIPSDLGQGEALRNYYISVTSTANTSISDVSKGFNILPTYGTITVTNPAGGENWANGSTHTIKWNFTGSPGNYVKIVLHRLYSYVDESITITNSTPIGSGGAGSYSWSISLPLPQQSLVNHLIEVTSADNTAISDSSKLFNISYGYYGTIAVANPAGGENWTNGSTRTIKWNFTDNPGNYVKIVLRRLYSTYSETITITNSTSIGSNGAGSYSWTISLPLPQETPVNHRIVVTSTANNSISDSSNLFNILYGYYGTITVTNPAGGEDWANESTNTIRWNFTGDPGNYVKIVLNRVYSSYSESITITNSTSVGANGAGSYSWTISLPPPQETPVNHRIVVTSTADSSISDSSNLFNIAYGYYGTITVTNPAGGEDWANGSTHTIKWNFTGSPGNDVKIVLHRLYSYVDESITITNSTPMGSGGAGSYSWSISLPPPQQTLVNHLIVVTSTADSSISDSSNLFNIPYSYYGTITVTNPTGGENWANGSTYTINWDFTGEPGNYVKIVLHRLYSAVDEPIVITNSTPIGSGGTGSYSWTISLPPPQNTLVNHLISVMSTADNSISDSSNLFNIVY